MIESRPYQQEALDVILGAWEDGVRRPLLVLPCGTGKTVVFARLLAQRGGRGLVLAHRDELVRQAVDKLRMVAPGLDVGVVKAGEDETDTPVVVASVQTLARPERLRRLRPDFRTVVVDEAHHAPAETYQRVLHYLGAFSTTEDGPLTLGVTATPERGDGAGLGGTWERIVYQRTLLDMILEGYLADVRAVQVTVKANLDDVHTRGGDFIDAELGTALEAANAPEQVAAAYTKYAAGRRALVFTPTVALAHAMAAALRGVGVAAEGLDGSTPLEERRGILHRLNTGSTMAVCNCAVLTEGFDEPSVDCIVVARPTKSKPLYIQMVGRGTRPYPGKADCLIVDVVGVSRRHTLVTATELFQRDLKGRTVREAVAREREAALAPVGAAAGEIMAADVSALLFKNERVRWVRTERGDWVVAAGQAILKLVETAPGAWAALVLTGGSAVRLGGPMPLGYAMGTAEGWLRKAGSSVAKLVDPGAAWRGAPATPRQVAALLKWRIPTRGELTKGQASDLLAAAIGGR